MVTELCRTFHCRVTAINISPTPKFCANLGFMKYVCLSVCRGYSTTESVCHSPEAQGGHCHPRREFTRPTFSRPVFGVEFESECWSGGRGRFTEIQGEIGGEPRGVSLDERVANIWAQGLLGMNLRHMNIVVCRVAPSACDPWGPSKGPKSVIF